MQSYAHSAAVLDAELNPPVPAQSMPNRQKNVNYQRNLGCGRSGQPIRTSAVPSAKAALGAPDSLALNPRR
jgi:hypothetical protein